jgi:hypothetical protein
MKEYANCDPLAELVALRQRLEQLEQRCEQQRQISPRRLFSRKFVLSALVGTLLMATVAVLWGDEVKAIFVDPNGNVGIGTQPRDKVKLDVSGGAAFSSVGVNHAPWPGQNLLVVAKQGDVAFNVTNPDNTVNWLTVLKDGQVVMNGGNVGIGTASPDAQAKLQVSGTTRLGKGTADSWFPNPDGNSYVSGTNVIFRTGEGTEQKKNIEKMRLTEDGNLIVQGKVTSRGRYQRDDNAETTYEIPAPYHLSLTAANYGGRTKTIPQDVLVALCGGPTGCEANLAMTRWYTGSETAGASRSVHFYYSKDDGHWRTSADTVGTDGDGVTKHVLSIWNVCYFTDGTYSNYNNTGDRDKGMQLLVWNGGDDKDTKNYRNLNRTCELTLTSGGAP